MYNSPVAAYKYIIKFHSYWCVYLWENSNSNIKLFYKYRFYILKSRWFCIYSLVLQNLKIKKIPIVFRYMNSADGKEANDKGISVLVIQITLMFVIQVFQFFIVKIDVNAIITFPWIFFKQCNLFSVISSSYRLRRL